MANPKGGFFGDYSNQSNKLIIIKWPKYPITLLLSIPIARYFSIKRLILENLFSLKIDPLINLIGITKYSFIYSR